MKRYKLLKDLPTFKAGQLAYISEQGSLIAGNPNRPEITDAGIQLMMYHKTTLEKFPNILTDWFEEIQEESTDSIHWKPKRGDIYWCIDRDGEIIERMWRNDEVNEYDYLSANTYRDLEEIEKAKERELAEARLRRTSTFKPNFKNGNGGWVVMYDHFERVLVIECYSFCDSGEPVRYETEEEALNSIKENREDWLSYFGVKQ